MMRPLQMTRRLRRMACLTRKKRRKGREARQQLQGMMKVSATSLRDYVLHTTMNILPWLNLCYL